MIDISHINEQEKLVCCIAYWHKDFQSLLCTDKALNTKLQRIMPYAADNLFISIPLIVDPWVVKYILEKLYNDKNDAQ